MLRAVLDELLKHGADIHTFVPPSDSGLSGSSELRQMTERIGFEGFMEYLVYGEAADRIPVRGEGKDAYQKRIDAAFEELFDGLKRIFPSASRENDGLYSAVLDFSMAHQETYTVMGFLAGLRFCTDMQKACCGLGGDKIQSAVKRAVPEHGGVWKNTAIC